MSQFIDEAVVRFESGKGGDGAAAFHREKHVPRGGPNGSDGGRGGDIVLVADRAARTLYDFKLLDHYKAPNGTNASGNKHGRDGEALTIRVPVGTLVFDLESEEPIADLDSDGATFIIAKGGRGGRGNLHFTSSVRQAPTIAEKGEPAESVAVKLELKLLADVGLIGLPNAGKSTLVSACSAARPKIGAYPFTTITPNLGVVSIADRTFVMADMPGLIEGASEGTGLGHQFLRHVERTTVLVHVIDIFPVDDSDPIKNYHTIESELSLYSQELSDRERVIVLNKTDLGPMEDSEFWIGEFKNFGPPVFALSAVTGQGVQPLLYHLAKLLDEENAKPKPVVLRPIPTERAKETWDVVDEGEHYAIIGKGIERMVEMTNLSNSESLRYLHRRFHRMGVIDKLRDLGAEDGDTVRIGDWAFNYMEGW